VKKWTSGSPCPTTSTRTVHACATTIPDPSGDYQDSPLRTVSFAADEGLMLTSGYYHVAAHVADDIGVVGLPPAVGRCRLTPGWNQY